MAGKGRSMIQKMVESVRLHLVPGPTRFEQEAAENESKTQAELSEVARRVREQIDADRSAKEAEERRAAHAAKE